MLSWHTATRSIGHRAQYYPQPQRRPKYSLIRDPEGPSTQYLRTLVPNTNKGMVFGTRNLKYWVLGPSGIVVVLIQASAMNSLGLSHLAWEDVIRRIPVTGLSYSQILGLRVCKYLLWGMYFDSYTLRYFGRQEKSLKHAK